MTQHRRELLDAIAEIQALADRLAGDWRLLPPEHQHWGELFDDLEALGYRGGYSPKWLAAEWGWVSIAIPCSAQESGMDERDAVIRLAKRAARRVRKMEDQLATTYAVEAVRRLEEER